MKMRMVRRKRRRRKKIRVNKTTTALFSLMNEKKSFLNIRESKVLKGFCTEKI